MIKNFELFGIIFLLNNCYVSSQGYQFPDAPKQQRTPQNTGCLNYGHSCLGAHGKRSRLTMPKFNIPQFVANLDSSSYSFEESGDSSSSGPDISPYAIVRSSNGRPNANAYGFVPYNLLSSYLYKSRAKPNPGQEDDYKTGDPIGYMKKNFPENIAASMDEWTKLLVAANMDQNAFKDHQRSTRQIRKENYEGMKDKKLATNKEIEKKDSKIPLESFSRAWLEMVN